MELGLTKPKSEKQSIEEYLKNFCIEECLDEVINAVIKERPLNPYIKIAHLMESKTLPEIIDIKLSSVLVTDGMYGVRADLITNIAIFSGIASYPYDQAVPISTEMKDYTTIEQLVKDALLNADPQKLSPIDEIISSVNSVTATESLALSIATCKAGARHKGLSVYKYIMQQLNESNSEVCLPIPIMTIASKINRDKCTQDVTITPFGCSSVASAIGKVARVSSQIKSSEVLKKLPTTAECGCISLDEINIQSTAKSIHNVLTELDLLGSFKLGISMRCNGLSKPSIIDQQESSYTYQLDDIVAPPEPTTTKGKPTASATPTVSTKTGQDVVDLIHTMWNELELISIQEPLHFKDFTSLTILNKKILDAVSDLKSSHGGHHSKLKYNLGGVGGDKGCPIQIIIDHVSFEKLMEMENTFSWTDLPYNTLKIEFPKLRSITQAILLCKQVKKMGWNIIIGCCIGDHVIPENNETFLCDVAVGCGVGQLMLGGIQLMEYGIKYNRLLEISQENADIPFVGNVFRRNRDEK